MAGILQLGDFIFQEMELPEKIPFGGEQRLSVKKMVGGARDVQALGPDPIPLQWGGIFLPLSDGTPSLMRAQYVNQMKDSGLPVLLAWDTLLYLVVIKSFVADYKFYQIPYTISCEVVEDLTAPVLASSVLSIDELILGDLSASLGISDALGNSTLGSLMSDLNSAISAVRSFAGAALSTVAQVLVPLNAARQYVQGMIATTEHAILGAASPFTALGIGIPVTSRILGMAATVNSALQLPMLTGLNATLGRMGTNLGLINSSVRTVTVGGGNLFDLAAQEYGDATAWTVIAQANGLNDPVLSGISTLVIPPQNGITGGILQA